MKELARISRTKSSFYIGLSVGVLVVLCVGIHLFDRLDLAAYDFALRTTPAPKGVPQVVVIGITRDDEGVSGLGEFPWSREVYARALGNLHRARVAAVGFDLPFTSSLDQAGDEAFARALADFRYPELRNPRASRAALAVYSRVDLRSRRMEIDPTLVVSDAGRVEVREKALFQEGRYVLAPEEVSRNIPVLTMLDDSDEGSPGIALGHINVVLDEDGLARTTPAVLTEKMQDGRLRDYYPLAVEVVRLAKGVPPTDRVYDGAFLHLDRIAIPITKEGLIHINPFDLERSVADMTRDESAFLANTRPILYYDFASLYDGRIPEDRLRGRLVFIGRAFPGQDLHATPFGPRFGVFLHAMLARTILEENFTHPVNLQPLSTVGVILALSLLSALVFFHIRTRVCLPLFLAAVAATVYAYLALFHRAFPFGFLPHGFFFSPVFVLAVLAGNFAFSLAINLSAAERTIHLRELELDLLDEAGRVVTRRLGAGRDDLARVGLRSTTAAQMGIDVEFSAALPEGLATIIGKAIGVEGCVLLRKDADGVFNIAGAFWEDPSFSRELALGLLSLRGGGLADYDRPLSLEDFPDAPEGIGSLLVVPFRFRDETIGALALFNKKAGSISPRKFFSEEDLRLLSTLSSETAMTLENIRLLDNVRSLFSGSMRALARAVDAKDPYTHGHSERVKDYALAVAKELGFSPNECKLVEFTALLHDIGKIGTPESLLNKEGRLTEEDWRVIRQHPAKGAEIIQVVKELAPIVPSIRGHHERYDGGGYPDGLQGEHIPKMAQIIAVADAFDAMSYERVYRQALSLEDAAEQIRKNRGTQFSPEVADAFLRYLVRTRNLRMTAVPVAGENDGI